MSARAGRRLLVLVSGVAASAAAGAAFHVPTPRQAAGSSPQQALVETAHLSRSQVSRVERGEIVVRLLPASAPHEVAISGAMRLAAPRDAYFDLVGDVRRIKQGSAVLALGIFGTPPAEDDVAGLHLDETDVAALRRCERGDCSSKLAALAADAFRRLDWSEAGATARAEALVRAGLVAHVRDYAERGDAAMLRLEEARFPADLAKEFESVLRAASHAAAVSPELVAYLERFPRDPLPGARSTLYWARETFGLKPVLSAYQLLAYEPPARQDLALLVSKQFYASRYIDVSLETTIVVDDPAAAGRPACYVIFTARSRVDSLRGFLGSLRRSAVEREARDGAAALLARQRAMLEAAH